MVRYECAFSQSELGKYFEWIIITFKCKDIFSQKEKPGEPQQTRTLFEQRDTRIPPQFDYMTNMTIENMTLKEVEEGKRDY